MAGVAKLEFDLQRTLKRAEDAEFRVRELEKLALHNEGKFSRRDTHINIEGEAAAHVAAAAETYCLTAEKSGGCDFALEIALQTRSKQLMEAEAKLAEAEDVASERGLRVL